MPGLSSSLLCHHCPPVAGADRAKMVHVLHIPTPGHLCSCPPFGDSLLSVILKATVLLYGGDGDRVDPRGLLDLFPRSDKSHPGAPWMFGSLLYKPCLQLRCH